MKNVILDLAVTLDGFIEGPNGEIDWCIMDDDMDFGKFLESVGTIFYGRVSYDAWGNFQPGPDAPETEKEVWEAIHSKEKVVFSRRHRKDDNAQFVSSRLPETVQEIKSKAQKDIWLYGGASLIKSFIDQNLIDIYRLSVHPVALGNGKPLFENLEKRLDLKLVDSRKFKSGVVQLIYEAR